MLRSVRPSTSFSGDQGEDGLGVEALGKRELAQDAVHLGVGGEGGDSLLDLGLGGVVAELDVLGGHPGLACELALAAHVEAARLVVTDEHRGETHRRRAGGLDRRPQRGDDLAAQADAVHEDGSTRSALELPGGVDRHDRPTISPFSSKSMMLAAGAEPRPGIVVMSPQIGYTKPAPTLARTSRTFTV